MEQTAIYNGNSISYTIEGEGTCLVFIHGYLEYKEIWSDFIKNFSEDYQILCIDLPGHGQSQNISPIHKMKEMANVINLIINKNSIVDYVLIGHSMGGYISLSYLDRFPKQAKGIVLFSSSALNDSTEKILARNRDIELAQKGEKRMLINANIPNMFSSSNIVVFKERIELIKEKVSEMSKEGIIAALKGMKVRVNNIELLRKTETPILFIAGKYDNLIQIDVSERQIENAKSVIFKVLRASGHMGYIEEELLSVSYIKDFLKSF